jgi:hypothetical protein
MVWTMSGQGYHLALDDEQVKQLLSCSTDSEVIDYASQVREGLRCEADATHVEGGYKDWNVLLLCLTDGTYDPGGGTYPLNKCFFGGHLLVEEGSIVNLVMPREVRDIAEALDKIDRKGFRERYMRLLSNRFFDHLDNWARDDEYMYKLFVRLNRLKKFYRRAAHEGRAVIFYTDAPLGWFFGPSTAL